MGHNCLITINNADLDRIALDADFGEHIHDLVRSWDSLPSYEKARENGDFANSANLAETLVYRKSDHEVNYALQAGGVHHASHDQIHLVRKGVIHTINHTPTSWEAMVAMAHILADFGYRIARKGTRFVAEANPDAPESTSDHIARENAWMDGWSDAYFASGSTAMIVLIDGLDNIRRQKGLGTRVAEAIHDWWKQNKMLSQNLLAGDMRYAGYKPLDSIGARNHANPMSIIDVLSGDRIEAVVTGGNWGRPVRPYLESSLVTNKDAAYRTRISNFHERDIRMMKTALLEAGFHVRAPGKQRAESPAEWTRKTWVLPPSTVNA